MKYIIVKFFIIFSTLIPLDGQNLAQGDILDSKEITLEIAEIILEKVYGDSVRESYPLRAILEGDSIWVVCGTPPPPVKIQVIDNKVYYVITYKRIPCIKLRKRDAAVTRIFMVKY